MLKSLRKAYGDSGEQGLGAMAWRKFHRRNDTWGIIKHHRKLGKDRRRRRRQELVQITPSRGSAREGWFSSTVYLELYGNSDKQPLKSFKLERKCSEQMPYKKTKVGTGKQIREQTFVTAQMRDDKSLTGRDEEKNRLWKYFYDDENE